MMLCVFLHYISSIIIIKKQLAKIDKSLCLIGCLIYTHYVTKKEIRLSDGSKANWKTGIVNWLIKHPQGRKFS